MLPLRSSANEALSLAWGERMVAVRCTLRWLGDGDRAFGVSEAGVVAGIGAGEPPGLVRPRERVARPPVGEDRRRVPCRTAKPADARTKTRAAATRRRVLNEDMARGCFRVTEYPGLPENRLTGRSADQAGGAPAVVAGTAAATGGVVNGRSPVPYRKHPGSRSGNWQLSSQKKPRPTLAPAYDPFTHPGA